MARGNGSEYTVHDLDIILDKEGAKEQTKVSYPVRYGRYAEVRTPEFLFQFTLNGEPKFIQGRNGNWPHPAEWLKRTLGNDWVYYFSGGYSNVYDCLGEYYVPCFPYPSNSLWFRDPFQDAEVKAGLQALPRLRAKMAECLQGRDLPQELSAFFRQVVGNDPSRLWTQSMRLFSLLQGRVSVLPPDCRHVDYDVLPLVIADGCLYNCGFCSVKSNHGFQERTPRQIREQIAGLKTLLGAEIGNYNALFLGQHDALNCSPELIEYAAMQAFDHLPLKDSWLQGRYLFLFGSVDSFLGAGEEMFTRLQGLPYKVFINIGLESADQKTLDRLRKPLSRARVLEAYDRMLEINQGLSNLEISANMVVDCDLPSEHWQSLREMTQERPGRPQPNGAVYLSPLSRRRPKEQIRTFQHLKRRSKMPLFLYLIQRL